MGAALVAAGYTVFAVNPLQAARYRERHGVSGAKSDAADAHALADMVRTDSHQLRPVAGDSSEAEAVKVVARAHKTLIWERTRHTQRLRHALRDYFPAALDAFADLDAADALELLGKAPDPASAARLTLSQITAALKRARRRDIDGQGHRDPGRAARASTWASPRWSPPPTPPPSAPGRGADHPATSRSRPCKGRSRRILAGTRTLRSSCPSPAWDRSSAPGCSPSSATTPTATPRAKARKNYAGTSPITRASGKKKVVLARFVHNDRLIDALMTQAFCRAATPRPAPAPTTTSNAPAASATTPPCASSPTASSASCTAASKPAPSTTRPPPGRTTPRSLLLDIQAPGMSFSVTPDAFQARNV